MKDDKGLYFLDPETREIYGDYELEDVHGTDLLGSDEHGVWWGTDRAFLVLNPRGRFIVVNGSLGSLDWTGYLRASKKQALNFAISHGAKKPKVTYR